MATKRKQDQLDAQDLEGAKKVKKGFTVGPANLPDGTYRRKGRQVTKVSCVVLTSASSKKDQREPHTQGQG